jgi:hypothetical protein
MAKPQTFRKGSQKYQRFLQGDQNIVLDKKLAAAFGAEFSQKAASLITRLNAGDSNLTDEDVLILKRLTDGESTATATKPSGATGIGLWQNREFQDDVNNLINQRREQLRTPSPMLTFRSPTRTYGSSQFFTTPPPTIAGSGGAAVKVVPGRHGHPTMTVIPTKAAPVVKVPATVMVHNAEGQPVPVYTSFNRDTSSEIDRILAQSDMPGWSKFLVKADFKVRGLTYSGLKWLLGPSAATEEAATRSPENLTPGGAVINLITQSLLWGVTHNPMSKPVASIWNELNDLQEGKAARIEKALLDNDLARAQQEAGMQGDAAQLLERAQTLKHNTANMRTSFEYMDQLKDVYAEGVKQSWEALMGAKGMGTNIGRPLSPEETQALRAQYANRQEAEAQSASSFQQALTLAQSGDAPGAVAAMVQSLDIGRNSGPTDPLGAYTWASEPDRYDKFLTAVAELQLQTGKPATVEEVRQIKDMFTNTWTEATGQGLFDPINLIPNAVLEDVFRVAVKLPAKTAALKLFEAMPEESLVRRLFTESSRSTSSVMRNTIFDMATRMSSAPEYTSIEDFSRALDQVGEVALDVQRAAGPTEAQAVYESARQTTPALKNLTYEEFKKFVDSSRNIDPTQWRLVLDDASAKVEGYYIQKAEKELIRGGMKPAEASLAAIKLGTERAHAIQNAGFHLHGFADTFAREFLNSKRVFEGSPILTDTVSGIIAKQLAQMTKGKPNWATKILEGAVTLGQIGKGLWAGFLLTLRPGYSLANLVDSMGRDIITGGNIFEDISALSLHTAKQFADELGFIPLEASQNLARADLNFTETVASRVLYEDWKPGWGLFSYVGYEYDRLKDATKAAQAAVERMPAGHGTLFSNLWDGFKTTARDWAGIPMKSVYGGLADFNTSIEFALRLRKFHREYFRALSVLEPSFLTRGLDGLSPAARSMARQIWEMSESNPARMSALVNRITGITKGEGPNLLSVLPDGFGKSLPVGPETEKLFAGNIANQTEAFIRSVYRNEGRLPNSGEIDKFVTSISDGLEGEFNHIMDQALTKKQVSGVINTGETPAGVPSLDDLEGSAPVVKPPTPVKMPKKPFFTGRIDPTKVVEDYTSALTGVSTVARAPGSGFTVRRVGSDLIVTVGDELLKDKKTIYNRLHEATQEVLREVDKDAINLIFKGGTAEYDETLKQFLVNPLKIRNENEEYFMFLVEQMQTNPQIAQVIGATGRMASYSEAVENLRRFGVIPDVGAMSKWEFEQYLDTSKRVAGDPDHVLAGINQKKATAQFLNNLLALKDTEPELWTKGTTFINEYHRTRETWRQYFTRAVFPGPDRAYARDPQRLWEMWNAINAEGYRREAAMLADLVKMDPKAQTEFFDNAMEDLPSIFLANNDMTLVWDKERKNILSGRWIIDGVERDMTGFERISLKKLFFSNEADFLKRTNPIQIMPDGSKPIRNQIVDALEQVIGVDTPNARQRAGYMMNAIDRQAEWVEKATGRPVADYYARLGFFKADDYLSRNIVRVTKDGIQFFGTGNGDIPQIIEQTSKLFFEDLKFVAEHNEDYRPILKTVEKAIGKGEFSDVFIKYIIDGKAPKGMRKPFESFSGWLSKLYDGIRETPLENDLAPEVRVALDKIFVKDQFKHPPTMTDSLAKVAAEASDKKAALDAEYAALNTQLFDKATPKADLDGIRTRMAEIDNELRPALFELEKFREQLSDGWYVWRTRQDMQGFPTDVIETPEAMGRYLRGKIDSTTGEMQMSYARKLWQVEQFQDAMLRYHSGDLTEFLFPAVMDFQMDDGIKTWLRNNSQLLGTYEASLKELEDLRVYLKSGKYEVPLVPKEIGDELLKWSEVATKDKSEMISLALNGGTHAGRQLEGAVAKVNRVMIDYNHTTRFDDLMKNIFPFWTFPSRSWPFWAETLLTHPQIVAGYMKLRRLSEAARRQAGAVNSQGKPLPSLKGYLPIPGTDMWINPLAPFSFSYVLNALNRDPEEMLYEMSQDEDVPPNAWVAKEMMENGPVFGFSVAPWVGWMAKKWYQIPDYVMPPQTLIPQINLVPRWAMLDVIHRLNLMTGDWQLGTRIYPEVAWHDYLVERDLLEQTQQRIEGMDDAHARTIVNRVIVAIRDKGDNAVWQEAYKATTGKESARALGGYFTGIYAKEFTDADADLMQLRNETNLLKSALNNHFQAALFELPVDAEEAWDKYNARKDTPEGWIYSIYTDMGYVRNEDGQIVRDPAERNKALAQKIVDEQNQSAYYAEAARFKRELDGELIAIGPGAPWEVLEPVYEKFGHKMASISYLNTYEPKYGTSAPIEIIQKKLSDKWFRFLYTTRPRWDINGKESHNDYQKRVTEWESNIPHMGALMHAFQMRPDIQTTIRTLHSDQQLDQGFWGTLMKGTDADGFLAWQRANDNVLDALNAAHDALYWKPYWDAQADPTSESGWKGGYAQTLAINDFLAQHPNGPPTAQEYFDWINTNYPGRFTFDEVQKWAEYNPPDEQYDIDKRLLEDKGEEYVVRRQVWDALKWVGPGKNSQIVGKFMDKQANVDLQEWYDKDGTAFAGDLDKLKAFRDILQAAVAQSGLPAPTREQLVQFMQAEQSNKQLKTIVATQHGMTYDQFIATESLYNNMSTRDFKKQFPDDYKMMRQFYGSIRSSWAAHDPIWAMYYLWKPTPPPQVKPVIQAGFPVFPQVPTTATAPAAPLTTGGWPAGLADAVGPDLSYTISQALSHDEWQLSYAAKTALKTYAANHPEWRDWIAHILAKSP